MEALATRSTQETHRLEQQQNQPTYHDVHEDYTDNEDEDQWLSTHARKTTTQAGTSNVHQQRQMSASYYSRTQSRQLDHKI